MTGYIGNSPTIDKSLKGTSAVVHDNTADFTVSTDKLINPTISVGGTLTATRNLILPSTPNAYIVVNNTVGGFSIVVKTLSGTGVTLLNGTTALLRGDGTNIVDGFTSKASRNGDATQPFSASTFTSAIATGTPPFAVTSTTPVANLSIGGNAATATTATTATTVTTNANLTGHVTSVGNATVLGSFTSAQLAAALTDETGTGVNVFATSPTFTGTPSGPTAAAGTNTTQLATTAFAQTASNWHGGTMYSVSAGATLTATDFGNLLYYNSASDGTVTLPSPTGNGGKIISIYNFDTGGVVTISCAQLIYAAGRYGSTLPLDPGASVVLTCDGSNWMGFAYSNSKQISNNRNYQTFTASGTWKKPSLIDPNAQILIECWGGGGGGSNVSTDGGGGGAYASRVVLASQMGATETVTVGAGGAAGNPGGNGGASSVGSLLSVGGGGGGTSSVGGGAGGGGTSAVGHTPGASVTNWSVNYKDTVTTEQGAAGTGSVTPSTYVITTGGGGGGVSGGGYGTGSIYGGGGGSSDGATVGGPSVLGGAGGNVNSKNGLAPSGGGYGLNGAAGAGARGEVRVRVL
jgi:hypothetical protein